MSKCDLADPGETKDWLKKLKEDGAEIAMAVDASDPASVKQVKKVILAKVAEIRKAIFEKKGMKMKFLQSKDIYFKYGVISLALSLIVFILMIPFFFFKIKILYNYNIKKYI